MSDLIKDIESLREKCDKRRTEIANINAKIELLKKQKAELEQQSLDGFGVEISGLPDLAEKLESKAAQLKAEVEAALA